MEVEFSVKAHLTVESGEKEGTCTFKSARYALGMSPNLDNSKYIENGLPNEEGCKAATLVLINALIANIHAAHAKGYWNDEEHLRFVVQELTEGLNQEFEVTSTNT